MSNDTVTTTSLPCPASPVTARRRLRASMVDWRARNPNWNSDSSGLRELARSQAAVKQLPEAVAEAARRPAIPAHHQYSARCGGGRFAGGIVALQTPVNALQSRLAALSTPNSNSGGSLQRPTIAASSASSRSSLESAQRGNKLRPLDDVDEDDDDDAGRMGAGDTSNLM
ncbi:unnamed protein product [Euphydryas editha]|uniref:Uncharacterized protein n=1 Tax=Euphydryas editha TaxID=104508 RepID=A0AAU9TD45_EUPED|nr:unnamed protein product [Euphydryas editha]